MSASNNFITRPVLSTVCSLLIVIVGLIAIPILPIENLPEIAPPTVKVQATYVGADSVAVEQGVTSVLEQQINGVENMDFITSRRCVSCGRRSTILPIGTASPTAAVVPEGSTRAIKKATPRGGFCMSDLMVRVQVITVG